MARLEHTGGSRRAAALVAALVAAGALLALAVVLATRGADLQAPARAAPGARPVVRTDELALTLPPGFTRSARAPEVPGLRLAAPIAVAHRGSGVRAVVGRAAYESPGLLPVALLSRLQVPPSDPERTPLRPGLEAYHHAGLVPADRGGLLEIYAVPATTGVVTVACVSGRAASLIRACLDVARGVELRRGRALAASPRVAFRERLPGQVEELDLARERARKALAAADSPARQAAAVAALGAAYGRAADVLEPPAQGAGAEARATVGAMRRAERASSRAAAALAGADSAGFATARREIQAAERALQRLLTPAAS
jgi:hypothetical protein